MAGWPSRTTKMGLKKTSKQDFAQKDKVATFQEIQTGAIQRIADATEAMADDHIRLKRQLEIFKQKSNHLQKMLEREVRSNAALRGHIKRIKKKISTT